jgi:hypothetical protein
MKTFNPMQTIELATGGGCNTEKEGERQRVELSLG